MDKKYKKINDHLKIKMRSKDKELNELINVLDRS